jgi:hypothetical protein
MPSIGASFSNRTQTGAIDDVHRAVAEIKDEAKRDEGKRIIEGLATMKYEIQHDRKMT